MSKIDLRKIKNIKRNLIIRILQHRRQTPQKEIVAATGIQKSVISNIINDLVRKRIIVRRGEGSSGKKGGRKPVKLELDVEKKLFLFFHTARNLIHSVVTDIYGVELWKKDLPVPERKFPDAIRDLFMDVKRNFSAMKILGIGISIPGVVDFSAGEIIYSSQMEISRFNLREYIKGFYIGEIIVENNANLSAIAEKTIGLCREIDNFLVFFLEFHFVNEQYRIGLGSGLMIDNKIYRGKNFSSGEISEILNEIIHNTLEGYSERIGEKLKKKHGIEFREGDLSQVMFLAGEGDESALAVMNGIAHDLGREIAKIVNCIDPAKVILAGSISPYHNGLFISALKTGSEAGLFTFLKNNVPIEISDLKHNVLSVGLLELLVNRLYPISDLEASLKG